MSMREAFLAEIAEHPDEDGPRLVYADWLDHNGDPEGAEFIRAQGALADREDQSDDEAHELKARAGALLKVHLATWTADLGRFDRKRVEVGFDRGFPELLTVRRGTAA